MVASVDPNQFIKRAREIETQAIETALRKASNIRPSLEETKVARACRLLCEAAFEQFKENLLGEFSQEGSLIKITLSARTTRFFYELPQEVRNILKPSEPN